ncbi:MAG: hypothetical protein K6E10_10910, partial [Eubacterium sp.]|nr:hypothetical protein [Eubacterium sp.]
MKENRKGKMKGRKSLEIKRLVISLIMSLLTVISVLSPNFTKIVNAYPGEGDPGSFNREGENEEYAIRFVFDSEDAAIAEKSNYYILVTAKNGLNQNRYYFAKLSLAATDGKSEDGKKIYDIHVEDGERNVTSGDWVDNNGNSTYDDYRSDWEISDVKFLKASGDGTPNMNSALQGTNISVVNEVAGYKVNRETNLSVEEDTVNKTAVYYDVIDFTKIEATNDYNYLSILGDAVDYGVVSKTILQNDHSETNFATTSYNPNGKNFDSDLSGNGTIEVPGNYLVGEITGSTNMRIGNKTPATTYVMIGNGYEGKINDESTGKYAVIIPMSKEEIDSSVMNMIDHMKKVSSDMANKEATITPTVVNNNLYIDTTAFEDGTTIYIDADDYDVANGPLRKDEGLNISMLPNQTIVFNFKTTKDVYISKAHVDFNDGTGVHDTNTQTGIFNSEQNIFADKIARQLVWNCPVATKVETHIAGGMFLASKDEANLVLGDTTCGWGISAGNTTMGNNGEFHFVYRGLKESNSVTLHAYKTVDGEIANSNQVFKFGVQRYDSSTKKFVDVEVDGKDSDGKDAKVPYVVENKNEIISIPVTYMEEGSNIYRIYEIGKADGTQGLYKNNKQEFYAQFNLNKIIVDETEYMVPGGVTYYSVINSEGKLLDKISGEKVVFENNTNNNGSIKITKLVKGPVTEEEFNGALTFKVLDEDGNTITVKKNDGTDGSSEAMTIKDYFELVSQEDGEFKYELTIEDVPTGK